MLNITEQEEYIDKPEEVDAFTCESDVDCSDRSECQSNDCVYIKLSPRARKKLMMRLLPQIVELTRAKVRMRLLLQIVELTRAKVRMRLLLQIVELTRAKVRMRLLLQIVELTRAKTMMTAKTISC